MNVTIWTNVRDRMPKKGRHEGVALAAFDSKKWRVQPFYDVWYETKTGIQSWALIPDDLKQKI